MKTSEKGINLIKEFEGCRLTAYRCPSGVWTIGYGRTKGVKKGMKISEEQASDYLKTDIQASEKSVERWDDVYHWSQNEFDALVSFTFNCGSGNLKTLLGNGNRDRSAIISHMPLYRKRNGKVLKGLERRRLAEVNLFKEVM